MGILNNIFGSSDNKKQKEEIKKNINWIPLTSLEEIDKIKAASKTEAIMIFKLSL